MTERVSLPENQVGPAEKLLDLVLNASAHLWHNRPGLDMDGKWAPATDRQRAHLHGRALRPVPAGLFLPAAVSLYERLLEIQALNPDLMAHFASYALAETEWRDLKVACCALMLVQNRTGEPVHEDDGSVAFYDDDHRAVGEAMLLFYEQGSTRMLNPKGVLRVAQLLETEEIAALNRCAGFGSAGGKKPPIGRWKSAAKQWLRVREHNLPLLEGLVRAGFKETIKKIARKAGYKPTTAHFFTVLGWKQKQSQDGHREVGLGELALNKQERFDGLSEEAICERIVSGKLGYKETVGRLPPGLGLTPAILVALLPSLSDRDLRLLTPTLEAFGLLEDADVRARWEKSIESATDQRALNIAKNVVNAEVREKLEEAADRAAQAAVEDASGEDDLHVMFLVDISGSMQLAIEESKEALSRILAGVPLERLHIASFNTVGTVLRPKAASRKAVLHMLKDLKAMGGTVHASAVRALHRSGVRIPDESPLVVIVAGDEAGEQGTSLASAFFECGYEPAALALIDCSSRGWARGVTVRECAVELSVPFAEVQVAAFEDAYQVPRVLRTILDAPRARGVTTSGWLEKVLATPLLKK
jgi:Mg-chelatase subunit ChlD